MERGDRQWEGFINHADNADADLILAGLLCARLCHDLAGPVGAVSTGAELLAEEGLDAEMGRDAIDMLSSSAAAAGTRLKFLRRALGSAIAPVGAAELQEIIEGFLAQTGGEPVTLEWLPAGSRPWNAEAVRLLLNLVLTARDCMARGGTLRVEGAPGGSLTVSAHGRSLNLGDPLAGLAVFAANGNPVELSPRAVPGYLAARLAARLGAGLTVDRSETSLVLRVPPIPA